MTILKYLVAFVVPQGQMLPLLLLGGFQKHALHFHLFVSRGEKMRKIRKELQHLLKHLDSDSSI